MATSSAAIVGGGELGDDALIQQVLSGNTALFELLMRRYNERLYRAARSIVRDDQEAEDVIQQAYVNAFAHLRQFNGSAQFSTWLTRIAINEALARVRRQGKYEAFDEEQPNVDPLMSSSPAENPERQTFAHKLGELLEWAIDRLPNGTREVFVLRDVEGLSTLEVAIRRWTW
jgi:RNA polymerase sigma-70 factor (ECF subfamily)